MNAEHMTTGLMWTAALVVAVFDIALLWVVARVVPRRRFDRLGWPVTIVSGVFWVGMWTFVMWGPWWALAYQFIFPEWARRVVPPVYGAMFAGIGRGFWWLARRLPASPTVSFCVLGALVSLPGHLVAFYAYGMLEQVPVLRGVSVPSALAFGVAEFLVYWAAIVLVAAPFGRRHQT